MSRIEPDRRARVSRGFTLLEIMMAMFVFAMLIGSIFAIVSGTTQLADEMERAHERDSQSHSFAQFCERTLRRLPAQAQVRLKVKQSGKQYLSQLVILNAPSILGAGTGGGDGLTIVETDQQPDGYLRIVMRLVAAEKITEYESSRGKSGEGLVLLNDVARCEWKLFNPASNEWETVWNDSLVFTSLAQNLIPPPGPVPAGGSQVPVPLLPVPSGSLPQRPTLIELTLALRTEPPQRFVFWVPPAQRPSGP